MGAWGIDTFENDDAGDWAYGLEEGGMPYVRETLKKAEVSESDMLPAPDACEVLAACDVIARLLGQGPPSSEEEEVDEWVASQDEVPDDDLVAEAITAIDRVLAPNSELAELWDESDEGEEWRECVEALRDRLTA